MKKGTESPLAVTDSGQPLREVTIRMKKAPHVLPHNASYALAAPHQSRTTRSFRW